MERFLNQCTPTKKKKCAGESGPLLQMNCEQCPGKEYEPPGWFLSLIKLWRLQKGGYPFRPNDLDLEQWMDIGTIEDEMEARKWRTKTSLP